MGPFRPAWTAALSLLAAAATAACGGAADVARSETLAASWTVEDVVVRGAEVRVTGELDADPRARTIDLVNWCAQRSVGRGLWTGARLVWWFTAEDVAAALGCHDKLAITAQRDVSIPAQPSSAIAVRLGLELDGDASDGIDSMSLSTGSASDVTSISVPNSDEGDLRLAVDGAVTMPAATEEGTSRFDVPTTVVVSAALRRRPIRVFGAGRTGVALVQLFVADQLANPPDPAPDAPDTDAQDE